MNRASKVEAFVTGTKNLEPREVRRATGVPESTLHRWRAGDRSLSEKNEERVDAYLSGSPMGDLREPKNVGAMLREHAEATIRTDKREQSDPLAADLERIYREFDTPEDRLIARENLAAMMRAEAAKGEARAAEREAEAAKIRARALYLAERRALLTCRRTKPTTGDGGPQNDRPD